MQDFPGFYLCCAVWNRSVWICSSFPVCGSSYHLLFRRSSPLPLSDALDERITINTYSAVYVERIHPRVFMILSLTATLKRSGHRRVTGLMCCWVYCMTGMIWIFVLYGNYGFKYGVTIEHKTDLKLKNSHRPIIKHTFNRS